MKRILFPLLVSALLSCQPEPTRVLVLYENAGHHKPFSEAVLPWQPIMMWSFLMSFCPV